MNNSITVQEPVMDSWQVFEGFTRYFPEVENFRHRANGWLADVQARKSLADNLPIPLAVLFASEQKLQGVKSL